MCDINKIEIIELTSIILLLYTNIDIAILGLDPVTPTFWLLWQQKKGEIVKLSLPNLEYKVSTSYHTFQ